MKKSMKRFILMAFALIAMVTMGSVATQTDAKSHHHCSSYETNGACIHLSNYTVTMYKGAAKTLKTAVYGESQTITWASSDTAVATVDSTGKVTAVANGTCNITATANGVTATCKVTVKNVSIKLNKTTATVTVNGKRTLTANVFGPSHKVTWASDNTAVATVNSRGRIKGVAVGTCNITATANGVTVKCAVTVQSATLKLNKTTKTIKLNKKYRLRAKLSGKRAGKKVTWTSSDESVATVSKRGVVRAKKAGTCNITATVDNLSAVCAITVKE